MVKRFLMTQLWRFQQSYAILSLVLWGTLLTFTSYPIISPLWLGFLEDHGIAPSTPGIVAVTLILLFLLIFSILFLIGLVYDKYLSLWREQLDVTYERNPYTREKLMVKEILLWRHLFLPAMRATAESSPTAAAEVDFVERWISKSVESDPNIRRAVEEAEKWIRASRSHN